MHRRFLGKCVSALAVCLVASCKSAVPDCGCQLNPTHAGCQTNRDYTDFLLAEGRVAATLNAPIGQEVRGTPTYQNAYRQIATAAVRPPDQCATESASQVTGRTQNTDRIASTECGVWMAEIERTLAQAGLRVVSWDALRGSVAARPPHEAARDLGADVLFLFNSAEASFVGIDGSSQRSAGFFRSDAYGSKGEPYSLPNAEAIAIRNVVASKLQHWLTTQARSGVSALSATIDATAVLTSTGEAAWFYRNTALRQLSDRDGQAYLFVRTPKGWYLAQRQTVKEATPVVPTDNITTGFVETVTQEGERNTYKVERLALFRSVAERFVAAFRSGAMQ